MFKKILFLMDLEGINKVKGEAYQGLVHGCDEWKIAIAQAVLEINAAAGALFDAGVSSIDLWDNHGGKPNIDTSLLDPRITSVFPDKSKPRLYFAKNGYDCVCFFGYHAMEGTLGGVLAQTMSSVAVQHYKINGKYVGEVDMDSYITAEYGIPSCFFAGGDIACAQAKRILPDILTVVTKREISRNEAEFRDNDELFADIKETIVKAVNLPIEPKKFVFPATFEKSYKRVEDAAKYLDRLTHLGISAEHPTDEILGRDAHTVVSTVHNISEFISCI